MKKIVLMFVAAAAVSLSVPASAGVVIKEGGMHRHNGWHRAHAEWRHRDWHPHHRGPAIVIKP